MAEEEKQEQKSTIKFSGTERTILAELSRNVEFLAVAVGKLTQQVTVLVKKD